MKKNRWLLSGALTFAAVAFLYFCGSDSPSQPQPPDQVKEDPSFAADIQAIFNANCTSSGCHGSAASAGLSLLQGQSYASLVNVASTQEPPKIRVVPGDADNSYLVIKIEGRQTAGSRMPFGAGALNNTHVQNIKNWINKGAKNN